MDVNILKAIYDSGLIYVYLVELISSDTNFTNKEREEHIKQASELYGIAGDKNLTTWLPDKDRRRIRKHCKQTIKVLTKEIEEANNGNIN